MNEQPEPTTEETKMREFARGLFAADDEDPTFAAAPDTTEGNRVPKEGGNVRQSSPSGDLREFVRDLFDRTD